VEVEVLGPLSPEDLQALGKPRLMPQAPVVQRLRDSHHELARAIASGVKPGLAAEASGYSKSYVSVILGDPAFQDLVAQYRGEVEEEWQGTRGLISRVVALNTRQLLDSLEAQDHGEAEPIPLRDRLAIHDTYGGAVGLGGKGNTTTNVQVNVHGERLAEARRRAGLDPLTGAQAGPPVIEGFGRRVLTDASRPTKEVPDAQKFKG
jgi:hypothetical protein